MNLIVEVINKTTYKTLSNYKDKVLFLTSLKDLSTSYAYLDNNIDIDLFISKGYKIALNMEKLFSENELDYVKYLLNESFFDKFTYILYSDLGIHHLLANKYKDKLIMRSPTYYTNSYDLSIVSNLNKYVVVSNEISINELYKINSNIKFPYIIDLFGKHPIFYSRRNLLTNYFNYRNINFQCDSGKYYIVEETRSDQLLISEDFSGTHIYEPKYTYLLEELDKLLTNPYLTYGIIHSYDLNNKQLLNITNIYYNYLNNNIDINEAINNIKEINIPLYKGAYGLSTVLLKGDKNE